MEQTLGPQSVSDLQRALRASEDRFDLLASNARDCALYTLNPQGHIASWNSGAQYLKGYATEEILGKHFSIFFTEEDKAEKIPARELAQAGSEGRCETERWRTRKDGSQFLASTVTTAIKDSQGSLLGFSKVTRNISGQQQLEQRFHQIVESAPNAMVMINREGLIEMVNTQTEQLFGYLRDELLGQPVEVLIPTNFHGHHPALRNSFFANPTSRPMGKGRGLYALHKNGNQFPVEIGLNPLETDEGTKVLSAIVDLSDRKEKERKREREKPHWRKTTFCWPKFITALRTIYK